MILVGVTGYKRSGKDSIAHFLERDWGFQRYALADPIKVIAMDVFDLTAAQVEGINYDREQVLPDWDFSVRHALQRIGTELGRELHEDTWVRYLMRRLEHDQPDRAVISDVRFLNEAVALKEAGAHIWRVHRPGIECSDSHASEQFIDKIPADTEIFNSSTLGTLEALVSRYARGVVPKAFEDA